MRKFVIAVVAGVMMATGVRMAQADCGKCTVHGAHMDAGDKTDKMALALDLNDKQKAAVKELASARAAKMKPAMEQMQAASQAAEDEYQAGVKKLLTAKQQAKYDQWVGMDKGKMSDCPMKGK